MKLVEFQNQRESILQIARRRGAKYICVFGSVSRDKFSNYSAPNNSMDVRARAATFLFTLSCYP
jgi:predicted nucleotidyltransferase